MNIYALLCQTPQQTPLASLAGSFIEDAIDLSPAELRALAAMLNRIADDAEAQPLHSPEYRPTRRGYSLNDFSGSTDKANAKVLAAAGQMHEALLHILIFDHAGLGEIGFQLAKSAIEKSGGKL